MIAYYVVNIVGVSLDTNIFVRILYEVENNEMPL